MMQLTRLSNWQTGRKRLFFVAALLASVDLSAAQIHSLRCENQINPLGIDCAEPRLSWQLDSDKRGVQQTAYRILVASSLEQLAEGQGDLWDSGRVQSDQSHLIAYRGQPLASNQHYFWKVQTWLIGDSDAPWSEPAKWVTSFLSPEQWSANWIAYPAGMERLGFHQAKWIWALADGETSDAIAPGTCRLTRRFTLPEGVAIDSADLVCTADNSASVSINGKRVAEIIDWKQGQVAYVRDSLVAGENVLEVTAVNADTGRGNPAGVLVRLDVQLANGQRMVVLSDEQWQAAKGTDALQAASIVADWGGGQWGDNAQIDYQAAGLTLLRKRFTVSDSLEAGFVNVSGLGHYELFVNGQKVGDHFLSVPWSVYEKTVYYDTYDIADLLKEGDNEFRILLGKGFYDTLGDRRRHGISRSAELMAILEAQLSYANGVTETVISDSSWEAALGPITHSAIQGGSDYDATRAEPKTWHPAKITRTSGVLRSAESPAMKAFERLTPIKPAEEPEPGVFVYDFGQNMSALPAFTVCGKKGQLIKWIPAEQRFGQSDRQNNGMGRVNQAGVGAGSRFEYTLKGGGAESWQVPFNYGGFQYLELIGGVPAGHPNPDGLPVVDEIESVHVRSSAPLVGEFACSNPLFMQIDESIDWAVRSNLAHVLTDCPHREKLGWLEVSYLMGPSISRRYDLSRLYAKVTRDIRDSQGDDGVIYTVAPAYPNFKHGFQYTPEWGAAGVILPWQLYQWYGDERVLKENLSAMQRFVDYMRRTSTDLVPVAGLGDWYDYGHGKGNGPSKFTPPELTAMATFYRCADIVAQASEVLGQSEAGVNYRLLADAIRAKFNENYYMGNGQYLNHGSCQTANAMALVVGLCEAENQSAVLDAIVADLQARDYQQTAGDVGFHYLVEALGRFGLSRVLEECLNRREEGSYGWIIDRGWLALPEAWNANTHASMNHCMLGHAQQWFYMDVLGIRQAADSVGFRELVIQPAIETDLEWARGHYDVPAGRVAVDWKKQDGQLQLNISIPANTTATVHLPAGKIAEVLESGKPVTQSGAMRVSRVDSGSTVLQIGSGDYSFVSPL